MPSRKSLSTWKIAFFLSPPQRKVKKFVNEATTKPASVPSTFENFFFDKNSSLTRRFLHTLKDCTKMTKLPVIHTFETCLMIIRPKKSDETVNKCSIRLQRLKILEAQSEEVNICITFLKVSNFSTPTPYFVRSLEAKAASLSQGLERNTSTFLSSQRYYAANWAY